MQSSTKQNKDYKKRKEKQKQQGKSNYKEKEN